MDPNRKEFLALQSTEHRGLLDTIDTLRSQGISRYVDLPQIIVCGDQSSGKSSVLEAISGMSFPTKDNLCTRFATELILRRSPSTGITACIIAGPERSEAEKVKLNEFSCSLDDMEIGAVVEQAKEVMGLDANNKVFSTDILRVEVSGPSQPHLTMVDLPGLFLAGNKDQSEEDSKLVESLVLSYMSKPRSIILAVVSAKSDFALQQVTKHARLQDSTGLRTMGLITKPDTLDKGSDSERFYVELAQNKDVQFCLGWHVLCNRSFATRYASNAERDLQETAFLSQGIWTTLGASQLGVKALRHRLSNVLRDQILKLLPDVIVDVEIGIKQCKEQLSKLGTHRATLLEQQKYLVQASGDFSRLIEAAISGFYTTDSFFSAGLVPGWEQRRLRAVVQNTLTDFAAKMASHGQAKLVIENMNAIKGKGSRYILRSEYMEEVKTLMKNSRGCELPGTYNPLIVGELFKQQCRPWTSLAEELANSMIGSTRSTIAHVLQHTVDQVTAQNLQRSLIRPAMEILKQQLMAKVAEIMSLRLKGHPITFNHYLTENIQKIQGARQRRELDEQFRPLCNGNPASTNAVPVLTIRLTTLLDMIQSRTELNMDNFACTMAIDATDGYYKLALKQFIDEIATIAMEQCLIQKLPTLFTTEKVSTLSADEIHDIAAESREAASDRASASEKLKVLENGMLELKRLGKWQNLMLNGAGVKSYD